jgi:hypothetical protein
MVIFLLYAVFLPIGSITTTNSNISEAEGMNMETARDVQVDPDSNEVSVQLTIHDEDLKDYISKFDESEQEDLAERAFHVGAMTLQLSETTKDIEHVRREFESMQTDFEEEIEDVRKELNEKFGDDGELADSLDEHLGEEGILQERIEGVFGEDGELSDRLESILGKDGSKIQAALDPDVEGTPTYRLKQEIREIRNTIEREAGREEERQQSWKKGDDFEETLGNLLHTLVYNTTHDVEHTGDEEGEIPGRDVGDYTLTLEETGQNIAVEAKSKKINSTQEIKEEMEEAIENRDADYGIFVTECESYIPNKVGYFQEYDQKILCVALSADEDDEIDSGFLNIAWNWARMRTIQSHFESGESVNIERIQTQVDEVRSSINRFSIVKTKCSDIESTAGEIKKLLDEISDDVNSDLITITTELSKATDS